jgi:hypothetical protein
MKYEVIKKGDLTTGEYVVEIKHYSLCTHNLGVPCPNRKTLQGGHVVCDDIFGKTDSSCPIDNQIEKIIREEGRAYIPKEYEKFIES